MTDAVVDADYSHAPSIYVVLRNIGKGAAKDITFEFSTSMESSKTPFHEALKPVEKQPIFEKGLDFLAPGAQLRFYWDEYLPLKHSLEQRGLQEEGIKVTSKYKSLAGETYETEWTINPVHTGARLQQQFGIKDLVNAIRGVRDALSKR